MKPLLIIPPAPARLRPLQALPLRADTLWQSDLQTRLGRGIPGTQDALAVIPDGGHVLASAWISKRHDLGVLTRVATGPEHRRRGYARLVVETLLSWFDMTGGKWLYATAPVGLGEGLLGKFGFRVIRRAARAPEDMVVVVRAAVGVSEDPLTTANGKTTVHDVTRANWPTMVVLLHNRSGPDPRVPLNESAVEAEHMALELISRLEAGTCHLKAAFCGPRLIGLASIATEVLGQRTYAMIMPHNDVPEVLRKAAVDFARSAGYAQVDFPMEALAATDAGEPAETQSVVEENEG